MRTIQHLKNGRSVQDLHFRPLIQQEPSRSLNQMYT